MGIDLTLVLLLVGFSPVVVSTSIILFTIFIYILPLRTYERRIVDIIETQVVYR
jgi:hypothetical protein